MGPLTLKSGAKDGALHLGGDEDLQIRRVSPVLQRGESHRALQAGHSLDACFVLSECPVRLDLASPVDYSTAESIAMASATLQVLERLASQAKVFLDSWETAMRLVAKLGRATGARFFPLGAAAAKWTHLRLATGHRRPVTGGKATQRGTGGRCGTPCSAIGGLRPALGCPLLS